MDLHPQEPYPLVLRCLKDSGLTAFFTRSSAANIPVNMELCRKLGLNKDNYSVSIPLGATINMAGAAVTITVMTMAACQTIDLAVDPVTAVILCVLAAVSACGASGVAGGSLLLIPMCCALFGISNDVAMQVVGIGFIIGVIQDSCETGLNSSSDVVFTATAEYRQLIKEARKCTWARTPSPTTSYPNKLRAPRILNHIAEGSLRAPFSFALVCIRRPRWCRPAGTGVPAGRVRLRSMTPARGVSAGTFRLRLVLLGARRGGFHEVAGGEKAGCHKEAESAKGKAHGVGLGDAFTSTSLSTCAASAPQVLASSEKALSLMSVEAVSAAGAT